ncbi:MalM family protein [Salinicola halophilus]|uniref:MalM family protein n=1 Tax=Salinicola halophilus TaxID=184065 RepID=UPI000DA1FFCC|nr:MalM family protein [Salinicola halophilus]
MPIPYRLVVPLGTLLFALAGCSTPLTTPPSPMLAAPAGEQALATTTDCCTSLASLPYRPLPIGEILDLRFMPETPAHAFDDGKSFFQAFELPRNAGPLSLDVTSTIRNGQVFAPTLLILDAAFTPVRRVTSESLSVRRPSGFSGARLGEAFNLTPGPDTAYLVIYSSRTDREATTPYESEAQAYARVRGLAAPPGPDPKAVHAATGTMTLEVAALTRNDGFLSLGNSTTQSTAAVQPRTTAPAAAAPPRDAGDIDPEFDYRRMIEAALKAGDIELAMTLAERAERDGHPGTRAWLAERLQARTP